MVALQMSYFAVGNATMAVADADVSPVGVVCNVTQVCIDTPASGALQGLVRFMSADPCPVACFISWNAQTLRHPQAPPCSSVCLCVFMT